VLDILTVLLIVVALFITGISLIRSGLRLRIDSPWKARGLMAIGVLFIVTALLGLIG
jgi:hypothetical protein